MIYCPLIKEYVDNEDCEECKYYIESEDSCRHPEADGGEDDM